MSAADRLLPELGPDFDSRWRRTPRALRRELIAEIRAIYRLLEEDDMPLLAGAPATPTVTMRPVKPRQASLFSAADTTESRKDNPFLPQSVRDRLQHRPTQPLTQRQEPMPNPPPATSHEQVDLERELRLRLGPVIDTLIESHLDAIKGELRVRLRAEMDRLIAEHVQK